MEEDEGPFYHVGILVRDISEAIPRFSSVFGVRFMAPIRMQPAMYGSEAGQYDIWVAYSQGPSPRFELIQGQDDDGIFGLQKHGEGFHHIGLWTPDTAQLLSNGLPGGLQVEATLGADDPNTFLCRPASFHGLRVEFVNERARAGLFAMVDGSQPAVS